LSDDSPAEQLAGRRRSNPVRAACRQKMMFAHQNLRWRHHFRWPAIFPQDFNILAEYLLFRRELGVRLEARRIASQQIFELRTSRFCAIHHG
jgi:hypothetical protein